ncbi:hypothetical protein SAMN05444274_101120 [Mariniphaga anaerophila]|uniref:Uncharacterized protein n=1 Tax=Mariniphaga anaerophila TaxID=1484053 RepID=A0A1M4SRA3_9BACT|nr:hypothetical protein [Mariniphaga anaerophila]SHE34793.1 hypothetical protein SAMN05444274_101120 [Mariniphaga anaerophila]
MGGETEVREMDEGSLSIPIVPIENRETMTDGSRRVGKGKSCQGRQEDAGS